MSEGATSKRLPRNLEPRKQAHFGSIYEGVLLAEDLPRVADLVHSIDEIIVRLAFHVDEQGERAVNVEISGSVSVICQRCLKPMDHKVKIDSLLAIVRDEEEAKQLPGRFDPWIVEEVEADTYELVEEELLLNIPVVAYHDFDCVDASLFKAGEIEQEQEEPRENPFQVLAGLKEKLPKE